jgi:hypothetical protein
MMNQVSSAGVAFILGCILATGAQIASADVTTQQRVSIDGIGGMKIANMSGTTTTIISGERSRTESDIQLQSKLIRMFARGAGGPHVDIVRLDQDRIEHLDIAKKEYTETTFAQLKEQMQKVTGEASSAPSKDEPKPTTVDDSKCEWSDPKADVKRTGEKATIAGYDAERLTITASQACKDKGSGQVCEFVLSLDEWLAPKFVGNAEALKFHRAYAQKMGLGTGTDAPAKDIAERAQSMFGRYKGIWGEIASKTKTVKGYPIKTSFAFAVGGPQCQGAQPSGSADASGADSAKSPAALAGQLGGKLAGLFHKKSDSPPPADASADATTGASAAPAASSAPPPLPDGMTPIITMSSELVSVSTDAVDPGVFEIPAGFKKIER